MQVCGEESRFSGKFGVAETLKRFHYLFLDIGYLGHKVYNYQSNCAPMEEVFQVIRNLIFLEEILKKCFFSKIIYNCHLFFVYLYSQNP